MVGLSRLVLSEGSLALHVGGERRKGSGAVNVTRYVRLFYSDNERDGMEVKGELRLL